MPVTLAGIALPNDIQWVDEFSGHGVGQVITPTLTGSLFIEETIQPEGRPMSLESGDGSWVERSVAEALATLAATPLDNSNTLTLVWATGATYEVVFDRSRGNGFQADEVIRVSPEFHGNDHPYYIKITLLIKA
jgi:hypothetical protein